MRFLSFILVLTLWLCALPLSAEDELASVIRETLLPAEFSRFAPRTALDMARQVPGFPIDEGKPERE